MIYLDYSATTPVNKDVLDSFNKVCLEFVGNANSLHLLGTKSSELINSATNQIANILGVKFNEIIYTSGASESNNMAIKGICDKYSNRGKHIVTTNFEHSSIYEPLNYLEKKGFVIDYVSSKDGIINLDELENLITDDTILVSVCSVNSETGIKQPIEKIGKIVKNHPKCFFHVDMTQSIGKELIDFSNVDLASFSAHKFYGLKGIGCLIKKENIDIEPLIHGGKSTTSFRSGTPPLPLIVSMSKALRLAYEDIENKINHVKELNAYLINELSKYDDVRINSNNYSIPHILNISILKSKPETIQHNLEQYDIYISTKTACSKNTDSSRAVYELTRDNERASTSIRISLSHLTTIEECQKFIEAFDKCYNSRIIINS